MLLKPKNISLQLIISESHIKVTLFGSWFNSTVFMLLYEFPLTFTVLGTELYRSDKIF